MWQSRPLLFSAPANLHICQGFHAARGDRLVPLRKAFISGSSKQVRILWRPTLVYYLSLNIQLLLWFIFCIWTMTIQHLTARYLQATLTEGVSNIFAFKGKVRKIPRDGRSRGEDFLTAPHTQTWVFLSGLRSWPPPPPLFFLQLLSMSLLSNYSFYFPIVPRFSLGHLRACFIWFCLS